MKKEQFTTNCLICCVGGTCAETGWVAALWVLSAVVWLVVAFLEGRRER